MVREPYWLRAIVKMSYALCLLVGCVALMIAAYHMMTKTPDIRPTYYTQSAPPSLNGEEKQEFLDALRRYFSTLSSDMEGELFDEWKSLLHYPMHVDIWHKQELWATAQTSGDTNALKSLTRLRSSYQSSAVHLGEPVPEGAILSVTFFFQPKWYDLLQGSVAEGLNRFVQLEKHGALVRCHRAERLYDPLYFVRKELAEGVKAVDGALGELGCQRIALDGGYGDVVRFETEQWIQYAQNEAIHHWFGGDRVVPLEAVNEERLQQSLDSLFTWFANHVDGDGKLPYQYYLIKEEADPRNQLTRQWIAAQSLGRYHLRRGDEASRALFLKVTRYLLDQYYYQDEQGLVSFRYQGAGYLSTLSISAQAVLMARDLEPEDEKLNEQYQAIIRTIAGQIREGRYFDTVIHHPQKENAAQDVDFAPGAAMIALEQGIAAGEVTIAPKILKNLFHTYYEHWQEKRSLYGAPWQILGYGALYRASGEQDDEYIQAIFDIADFLASCQVNLPDYPATAGSFNEPACSVPSDKPLVTAMRSEGLTEAYRMAVLKGRRYRVMPAEGLTEAHHFAKQADDSPRVERYHQALQAGMRHVLQGLVDEENVFYFPNREKSLGALRYGPRNLTVRIDGPAHAMVSIEYALRHVWNEGLQRDKPIQIDTEPVE